MNILLANGYQVFSRNEQIIEFVPLSGVFHG